MFLAMSPFDASFVPAACAVAARPTAPAWRVHGRDDPQRAAVEAFIRQVYARHHGAVVRQFMPWLVSLHEGDGIVAAAGYRLADGPLFLEHYLDAPVEVLLSAQGSPVARRRIAEVGHLAATRAGEGRRLIRRLGPHLAQRQVEWVVSTVTEELRHLFVRMGVTPLAIGTADPRRLGAQAADWGRYYDHHPMVLAGHLPQALRRFGLKGGHP